MTPAETAEKIADMLRSKGLDARVHDPRDFLSWWVVVGVAGSSVEEPVAEVSSRAPGDVRFLTFRLGVYGKTLRARKIATTNERDLRQRCADIADRVKAHIARREAQVKAWQVVDTLKSLGMPCTARNGRVVIEMDLSPEYAAEVGPKIAAVMSERKA